MSMEQIIYELNSKKYLLVEIPIIINSTVKKEEAKYKKYGGIYQGVKEINRGGFFTNAYAVVKVLIPEINIEAWNAED